MKTLIRLLIVSGTLAGPAFVRADAAADYLQNCASCHGRDGAGHTRAGRLLKVRDLTDAAYQKSFSDGKAFDDTKNGLRDSNGHLVMRPMAGKLTDDQIKALVVYVRAMAK